MNKQQEFDDPVQEDSTGNPPLPEAWIRFLDAIQKELVQPHDPEE
jgi:hypothetical protein